ncbi:helix-turn-helix domain-containing protein [Nodosilinea sp. PGN35]|uniref:helix-turn-helix domain-containing protein n=1 Tax=Nodosilinea sp. PGN35 TaxID=3020489 RepID=UPI0023B31969|nr:helix-turn-helix transcriptional regulator [Nodosilinea sp. TSF1-S3]MDF0369552.1 helix-turn-helix transcriptional regulator [Nodosilinea sp. TSF1-S3]
MPKHDDDFLRWFGSRLREIRHKKGLSQEELAELAGIDRTYVGGVERGERNLSLLNVKRISDALGINVKDLFDNDFKL